MEKPKNTLPYPGSNPGSRRSPETFASTQPMSHSLFCYNRLFRGSNLELIQTYSYDFNNDVDDWQHL